MPTEPPRRKIKASLIDADEHNPNRMTKQQMDALKKSIETYGNAQDVWVAPRGERYVIVDGEHRYLTLKDMRYETITCRVLDLDDDELRVARQVANKLKGTHDPILDAAELKLIFKTGKLDKMATMTAIDTNKLKAAINEHPDTTDKPTNMELRKEKERENFRNIPIKKGDIYLMGRHKIACGDCTDPVLTKKLMPKEPDVICTDPPYSSGGNQDASKPLSSSTSSTDNARRKNKAKKVHNDALTTPAYLALMRDMLALVAPQHIYIFTDWRMWQVLSPIAERSAPIKNMLVWDKQHMGIGATRWRNSHELILYASHDHASHSSNNRNVIQHAKEPNIHHTTQKPVGLISHLLSSHKGTVYDPFCGAGGIFLAAEKNGMTAYGIEYEPEYVETAINRWEQATGQKAKKVR